jgi:peptidoglycan/LPS O-acetylase OafA/YrhL
MSKARNLLIDCLRGLSLLMVIVSHFGLLPKLTGKGAHLYWGRTLEDINTMMGYYGVVIFFVISGFLITRNAIRRYPALDRIDFAEFWWLRFARLMPMLLLCIVAMSAFHFWALPGLTFGSGRNLATCIAGLLSFRFNDFVGKDISIQTWNPLWSLSVEEMFYLALPVVARCWNGAAAQIWTLTVVIATASYLKLRHLTGVYDTLGCMDLLALGCIVALIRPERLRGQVGAAQRMGLGILVMLLGLSAIIFTAVISGAISQPWSPPLCAVGAALFLLASQWLDVPRRLAAALTPISIVGVISYEAYLLHDPLRAYLEDWGWHNDAITALVVLGAAWLVHSFISEPLNLALRKLPGMTQSSQPVASQRYGNIVLRWLIPAMMIVVAGWLVPHR